MEELATQEKMVLFVLVPWDLPVQLVRVSVYFALVLYLTLRQINHAHFLLKGKSSTNGIFFTRHFLSSALKSACRKLKILIYYLFVT